MNKNLVIVRKGRDGSHSHRKVEANVESKDVGVWLFVDDLVDTGKTLKRVKRSMDEWAGSFSTYGGQYLYEYDEFQVAERT